MTRLVAAHQALPVADRGGVCTRQVAAAEAQLLAAVSGASSSTWTTMQGTQAALGKAKDAMKYYDSALKNYNSSLIEYEKEATKLEALKAALDELTANCSIPTPPPTCADALLDLKTAIAKQTATCEIKWVPFCVYVHA